MRKARLFRLVCCGIPRRLRKSYLTPLQRNAGSARQTSASGRILLVAALGASGPEPPFATRHAHASILSADSNDEWREPNVCSPAHRRIPERRPYAFRHFGISAIGPIVPSDDEDFGDEDGDEGPPFAKRA